MIGYVGFSFLKTRQVPHIELKIVQNQLLLINSKAFPWHLELSFTKKIPLNGFLNNVKNQKLGLELVSNWENLMSSILEVNKSLDENFSKLWCDKMRSKSARFYCLDAK